MRNNALSLLKIRKALAICSLRQASYCGKIYDTPSYTLNGVTYKKMFYPHTITAFFVNTPWLAYAKSSTDFRYLYFSIFLTFILVYYIDGIVNSPENVAYWKEKDKQDYEKAHKKEWDI